MRQTFNEAYNRFLQVTDEDQVIMCFHKKKVAFGEFNLRVNQLMKHLVHMGVRSGDGVGYTLPNCYDVIPLFTAIARLGAYTMPLFVGIPNHKKIDMYQKCNISYIISTSNMADELYTIAKEQQLDVKVATIDETANNSDITSIYGDCGQDIDIKDRIMDRIDPDAPLLMGSSSGTTGIPKFVLLSQQNVGAEMIVGSEMITDSFKRMGIKKGYSNIAFPLSTSVMLVIYGMIFANCSVVFDDDTSQVKFFENTEYYKCDTLSAPPAYFESLTMFKDKQPYDVSSVKVIGAGMDFCSAALLKRLKGVFPNVKYYSNGYGLVETANIFTYHTTDISTEDFGESQELDVCQTAENMVEIRNEQNHDVKIGEVGQVYIKGPNVIKGYWNRPEEDKTAFLNGWFKTGDIAKKTGENSFILMGRQKFFIKRGGKQISPIVVQNEINKVEGVIESGVVGVPHPLYGEMIWAFVATKEKIKVELKDIKKKCREDLAFYMLPDHVTFLETIPKKPGVGKMDFAKMREMAQEELAKMHIVMN